MSNINNELAAVLLSAQTPGDFSTGGTCLMHSPWLQVEGVGPIALPLLPAQAQALVAAAEPAPYGRGQDTVVDTAVRRTWQVGAERVQLQGKGWAQTLQDVTEQAAAGLGAGADVQAEFYKLLVYDVGSFFVSHRDTEKVPRMFGTLVIGLPSLYAGGDLLVRHRGREARWSLRVADPSELAFTAFYADCVHEVLPITAGCRLALVYNLVHSGKGPAPKAPDHHPQTQASTDLLQRWVAQNSEESEATPQQPPQQLVHPLDHAYTPAELSFSALKGADAARAAVLVVAAQQAECELHVALMQIEQSGAAEYSGDGRHRGWRRYGEDDDDDSNPGAFFEMGEIFERSLLLSHWQDPKGAAWPAQRFPFTDAEVCPADALQDMEPDEQHFHEATGNEGATFERSYQRAALVLWPRQRRLQVLRRAGLQAQVAFLQGLVLRWQSEPNPALRSPVEHQIQELAPSIVNHWPTHGGGLDTEAGLAEQLLLMLQDLNDLKHLQAFITRMGSSTGGYTPRVNEALVAALARLPAHTAGILLAAVLAQHTDLYLCGCTDLLLQATRTGALQGHLQAAAKNLLQALPGDPARLARSDALSNAWRCESPDATQLCKLLQALCIIDAASATEAVAHCLAWPKRYGLDAVVVPAAITLWDTPALRKQAAVQQLADAACQHLRVRVRQDLAPPSDWQRAAEFSCRCVHCQGLRQFLLSAVEPSWRFKAKEADRDHVQASIRSAHADLDCSTERKGSPHVLVCTKNQASYERRVKQRRSDLQQLDRLG